MGKLVLNSSDDNIDAGRRLSGSELQAAKAAARERYATIAELLKAEAGVDRHYHFKQLGGLAFTGKGRILAPEGVTRRQLYVIAHECGHIVLHSSPAGQAKPGHVKEHEAETYAHRAFQRYGLEVPEKSARWARAYVGQWIMKDRAAGIPICPMAADFAAGRRFPHHPLPSIEGQPPQDFSKSLDKFVAKGVRFVAVQETVLATGQPTSIVPIQPAALTVDRNRQQSRNPDDLPVACGTCQYKGLENCKAHLQFLSTAWNGDCLRGNSWRPKRKRFLARLADALLDRISGRVR